MENNCLPFGVISELVHNLHKDLITEGRIIESRSKKEVGEEDHGHVSELSWHLVTVPHIYLNKAKGKKSRIALLSVDKFSEEGPAKWKPSVLECRHLQGIS